MRRNAGVMTASQTLQIRKKNEVSGHYVIGENESRVVEAHPRKNRRGAKCEKLVPVEVTARTMPQRTTIVGT